jgi:energy-coupling factor transport system permease protein
MRLSDLDPRVKLLILMVLSSVALILRSPFKIGMTLMLVMFMLVAGEVKCSEIYGKIKSMLGLVLVLFVSQCVFNRSGTPLLVIQNFTLATQGGLETGIVVSLRLCIILLTALVILTGEPRDYILAMTQSGIPYEIAFMSLAALRFIPMLREEAQDVLCAVQMRGTRLKKSGFKHKAKVYTSIMIPIIAGAIHRSEQLSIAMEARGFRAYPKRTSMRRLQFHTRDVIYLAVFSIVLSILVLV